MHILLICYDEDPANIQQDSQHIVHIGQDITNTIIIGLLKS